MNSTMNPFMQALAEFARGFLAYIENQHQPVQQPPQENEQKYQEPPQQNTTVVEVPKSIVPQVSHWENFSLNDIEGEQWHALNIPGREAYVSNKGRVKLQRIRGRKGSIIVKTNADNGVRSCVISAKIDGKAFSCYVPLAKVVLLAFDTEKSNDFSKRFPNATARSANVCTHKNGDRNDCSIENLEWVSEEKLADIEYRILKKDKSLKLHGKKSGRVNHLAPLSGEWKALNKQPKTEPSAEIPQARPTRITEEEWRDVQHFVGFYQVSNLGNVRSLDRYVYRYGSKRMDPDNPQYLTAEAIKNFDKKNYRFARGIVLKKNLRLHGEIAVSLSREGINIVAPVAQIMVEAFYPERAKEGKTYTYEYVDGDANNCALDNLRFK